MRFLILEDNFDRIQAFQQKLKDHEVVITDSPEGACKILNRLEPFDYIFLDHDMGQVFEKPGKGTGYEVAEWISKNQHRAPKKIFIHTANNVGAAAMLRVLGDAGLRATYIPFLWKNLEVH